MRIISLFILGLVFFAGCSSDSPTSDDNGDMLPTEFEFTATINGTSWEADSYTYTPSTFPTFAKDIIGWIGQPGLGEQITISLINTAVGTYTVSIESTTPNINYTYDNDPGSAFEPDPVKATEGSITIEKSTTEYIQGTFSFKGTSFFSQKSFDVTNGTFIVKAP